MPLIELIQDQAWAIHPAKLDEIVAFVETRMSQGKPEDLPEFASGKSGNKSEDSYQIKNGVAVIPVFGTLMKRANLFTRFSGGTSYQLIQRDIQSALENPKVKAIALEIDSPGGSADGVFEVADFIFSVRGQKPIVAVSDGLVASAAYLIASAADKIFVGPATYAGSIGVISAHFDYSRQDEKYGVKRTYIYAGKYKALGNDAEPLNEEAKDYLQGKVDYLYGLFLDAVAKNRGVDPSAALSMADGKIFIGEQAAQIGLVDSIGTVEEAIAFAGRGKSKFTMKGLTKMTIDELKAQYPELYNQIHEIGATSMSARVEAEKEKSKAEGFCEGQASERSRVVEILGADGDRDVAKEAIENGLSAGEAFKLFFKAEKDTKAAAFKELQETLSGSVGASGKEKEDNTGSGYLAEVDKYQSDKNCTRTEALKAVAARNPELYKAYRAAIEADRK